MAAPAASRESQIADVGDALRRNSGLVIAIALVLLMELAAVAAKVNPFEVLISGLALGSLYAVVALGYTMVYGIIELINFAHGDVFAFGAFVSLTYMERLDGNMADNTGQYDPGTHFVNVLGAHLHVDVIWLAAATIVSSMIVTAVICGILGVVIERIAYRPLRNAPRLAPLITAIGVSLILENALLQWRGGTSLSYPSVTPLEHPTIFGAQYANVDIVAIVAAVILMLGLDRFVNRTKLGKAMRAVAQDREAATMMGINVDRIISVTFFIGSALAGAGAVVYGMDVGSVTQNMGFALGLYAFTAAVLGGIGNIRGAMLGGILIGLIQQFINLLPGGTGTQWSDVVVFAMLVLILVFRPSGLLGAQIPEKV